MTGHAIQWSRSLIFNLQMYLAMAVLALVFLPWALISRHGAFTACHAYCAWVLWTARWMIGLKTEIRGVPPTDEVVIAAKHQSFLDILVIFHAVPQARFIMKRSLLFTPVLGQYARRIGCVPVNRLKGGQAIRRMMRDVTAARRHPGQLVIYPQGTRIAPGAHLPYKSGISALYTHLGQDCVPVATNAGVFWPRRSVYRGPGTAVVEFLPRIPKGMARSAFIKTLETNIETASDRLLLETGFQKRGARLIGTNPKSRAG
ncbi:MAG: lysophospholipid acyltransferase family protein [Pseudomonadota bacterium]